MWQQINKYYFQNEKSTICKIGLKPDYELWFEGKQYCGYETADAAKLKFNELTKGTQ